MNESLDNLRERIKKLTRPFHKEAELAFYPRILLEGTIEPAQYANYLFILKAMHTVWEKKCFSFSEWEKTGIDVRVRSRLPQLQKDLSLLGSEFPDSLKGVEPEWIPRTFAESVGLMYVLEGSTLGGRILSVKIPSLFAGHVAAKCVHYFSGYGEKNEEMWSGFCDFLVSFGQSHPDLESEVISGACMSFMAMRRALDVNKT